MPDGEDAGERTLFYEPGGRWGWVMLGPAAGLAMLGIQVWGRAGINPVVPVATAVVVSFFLALQVYAARTHASVRLTPASLREGVETLELAQVRWLYSDADRSLWEQARPLGELSSIPKGRTGIGLRLTGGARAQAWAKRHRELREALARLVPAPPPGMDVDDDPEINPDGEQW